jgi:APA family basic amino acid/polyamine antiporter
MTGDRSSRQAPFGLPTLTFLVVANMVGAGVFTTSGFALADLGTPGRVIAAWILGGLIALAGAASYGRLVRVMPESGGEYLFLTRAAHPLLGFIAGWVSLIAGFTGATAFAATAFESYVAPPQMRPPWLPADAVAVAVIIAGGLLHGARVRFGARAQNTVVVIKLVLLAGFFAVALGTLGDGTWRGAALPDAPGGAAAVVGAFAVSLVWISLSYSGFNAAVYVAEEAVEVRATVPAALMYGTLIVFALYVALNSVFVLAPPPDLVAGQADVAAVTAQWLAGGSIAALVRAIIAFALFSSVSSMLMAAPRVYAKMADDGLLPAFLGFRGETPRAAVIAQTAISVLLVFASTLQDLLSYLGLTLSLSAAVTVACLFLPATRAQPLWSRASLVPFAYVASTLCVATVMGWQNPAQVVAAASTFAAGALAYALSRRARRSGRTATRGNPPPR